MQPFTLVGALVLLICISSGGAEANRHYRQVFTGNQPGVCRYGRRLECCYGWKRNSKGQCEAQCEQGCKHGECVGPNKCKCFQGYTGKTCNQDLNECGLKPRPCEHRCMNTYGSYKCYCLNGYTLLHDGSCANSRTCSLAHCQYGCEEVQGETRCLCPSAGLQLGQDERTCVAIPNSHVSPKIVGGKQDEDIKNIIPEPATTLPPKGRQQPFDYDGEVYIGSHTEERPEAEFSEEDEEQGEKEAEDNQLNPRGDVFISEDFESVVGPATEVKEIQIAPAQEEFIVDCNFDQGACEWVQDKADDMDWSVAYHDNGAEYYMALSGLLGEPQDVAKLKLFLSDRAQQGSFCLTFDYRVVGHNVGTLRVLLDNNAYPVWEQTYSRHQGWQTELLTVAWKEEAPQFIIFEAQRGTGLGGEIGLDNVVLTSGPCQEDVSPIF
ncbi:epidermal growth factor-like protein 6 isoform X4 [Channa argus]|uniref:epidermal growth factor-like protein 6 isoform X4 n=1 Tax=Channa argus TaxID=215402 RepID=UPI003521222B